MPRFASALGAALVCATACPVTAFAATHLGAALELDGTGAAPGLATIVDVPAVSFAGDDAGGSGTSDGRARGSITAQLGLKGLVRLGWDDLRGVATAPRAWDRRDWMEAGAVGATVVASALWLDGPVRDDARRSQTDGRDRFARQVEKFGTDYAVLTVGAFYGYGLLAHDRQAESTGIDAGISSVIAAGIITPVLKETLGRARPIQNQGRHHFSPFGGDASFPSGHTTEAFAVASVVAEHYDSPWVKAGAYGLAGLVGAARVYRDAHWVSDTLAGAAIGAFIGHEVVRLDARLQDTPLGRHAHVVPTSILGAPALALQVDF
jgi:hypothetical protein